MDKFLDFIAALFRKLFNVEDDEVTEPVVPSDAKFEVGDRVYFGGRTGVIDSIDAAFDADSPYFVKFDDSEEVEGTFAEAELKHV